MEQKNPNALRGESQSFPTSSQFRENARSPSLSEAVMHGKEAVTNAGAEAMNSAESDIQALRNDLNSLKDTVTKFASEAGSEATKTVRDAASNVVDQVGDAATDLAGRGANAASAAGAQAKSFAVELESMARRNPLGAMAGAIMVGVLIGVLGRRS